MRFGIGLPPAQGHETADAVTFDYTSPEIVGPQFWDAARGLRRHGPLVRVESSGGWWAATTFESCLRVAQDWETFSSAEGVALNRPGPDVMPYIMPLEVDPPRQRRYRHWVNPQLTIKAVADLEPAIRDITNEVIDAFAHNGSCDIVTEFTRRLPGTVLFRLLFHCSDDDFRTVHPWARMVSFSPDPAQIVRASAELRAWAERTLAARSAEARVDDLVDVVLHLADAGLDLADADFLTALQIFIQGGHLAYRQTQDTIVASCPDGAITQGQWTHVAASWDGHTSRLYVNGVEVASSTSANKEPSNTSAKGRTRFRCSVAPVPPPPVPPPPPDR